MEAALMVTIAIFMAGVVFGAGKITARIERLEEWRGEVKKEHDELFRSLRRIERRLGTDEGE